MLKSISEKDQKKKIRRITNEMDKKVSTYVFNSENLFGNKVFIKVVFNSLLYVIT